jgi:hypothetical protein
MGVTVRRNKRQRLFKQYLPLRIQLPVAEKIVNPDVAEIHFKFSAATADTWDLGSY